MRYLHPVAATEKFIAKGVYRFYEGGTLLPYQEAWTRHSLAGGGILTRLDHEFARQEGFLLGEVLEDEKGHIERLNVRSWINKSPIHSLRAEYVFFPSYVQASLRVNEDDTIHQELSFPDDTLILLPFHLYAGTLYKQAEDSDAKKVSMFTPHWQPGASQLGYVNIQPFPSIVEKRDEVVLIGSYKLNSVNYGHISIDGYGTPLRIEGSWTTVLTEYAHI